MQSDMNEVLREMTGMELLWIKLNSNAKTREMVEIELDRRAALARRPENPIPYASREAVTETRRLHSA
jgi:hypothetical protein